MTFFMTSLGRKFCKRIKFEITYILQQTLALDSVYLRCYPRYSSAFIEPEVSLPCSQQLATEPPPITPFQPISLRHGSLLSFHMHLCRARCLFSSGLPTTNLYAFLNCPMRAHAPPYYPNNIWRRVRIVKFLVMQYFLSICHFPSPSNSILSSAPCC